MKFGDSAISQGGADIGGAEEAQQQYWLRLDAHKGQLPLLHEFVEERAPALHLSTDAQYDMLCAVTEIVTNCIVHGYAGRSGVIDVELWLVSNDLYMRVCDQAPTFDPTSVPTPDTTLLLDERPPGGMGIHVARRFTDGMIYRALPQGGNELTLIRNNAVEQGES